MIQDEIDFIKQIVDERVHSILNSRPAVTLPVSKIDPAYSSGNPKTARAEDGGTAQGATKKVLLAFGIQSVSASVATVEIPIPGGTALMAIADVSAIPSLNAVLWRGVGWAKAGATNTAAAANTEQSVSGATFTTKKRIQLFRPGRYRVTFDLKRTGGSTAEARVVLLTSNGGTDDVTVVSTTAQTSNTTHTAQTLDMNTDATPGAVLGVQIRESSGSGSAEIQNCEVKYDDATANGTPVYTVLQD